MDYASEFRINEQIINTAATTPTTTTTNININPFLPQNIRNKVNYLLIYLFI